MKKLVVILSVIAIFVCGALGANAATKQDLIDYLGTIPSAIENKEIFYNGAVQLIKDSDFTAEQMDALLELLKEAKTAIPENKGPAAADYTKEQRDKVLALVDEACKVVDYSYEVTHLKTADGATDWALTFKDDAGKKVLVYTDGVVKATGINDSANNVTYLWLAAGVALILAAGAVVIVRKKASEN